jgi:hypothetical protein
MILYRFFIALGRSWIPILGCMAFIAFVVLSFLSTNEIQIRIFSLSAVACFLLIAIGAWATEHQRAENAQAELLKGARPRVIVDGYFSARDDNDREEDYIVENLRIVNKGNEPAIAITMRPLQIAGRTARIFASIPELAPGEAKEIRVLNLRRTLERAAEKAIKSKGHALTVRLPLVIEYQDLLHDRWISEHVVLFGVDGISIDIVRSNQPPQWTAISTPRGF